MSKLAEKMKANLEALKQNKHAPAIRELQAKADKAEAAGPQISHMNLKKRIFDELVKIMPGEVEWVEPEFVRNEVEIEQVRDYSIPCDYTKGEQPAYKEEPRMWFGWRGGDFRFIGKCRGFNAYVDYKDTYEQTYSWRHRGKHLGTRIYVGDYGNKDQFKQLKDGTHRYADIAQSIKLRAERYKAMVKAELQKRRNADAVTEVKVALNEQYKEYNGVVLTASTNPDAPVSVKIEVTKNMTIEGATELLNVLKKYNIG